MKKNFQITTLILFIGLIMTFLTACSSESPVTQKQGAVAINELSIDVPQQDDVVQNQDAVQAAAVKIEQISSQELWIEESPRIDEQGAVVVEIVPLNPNNPGQTLDFQVALNTHSVDLGMDLAALATLETDTGHIVQATLWDAPRGGHHVSGTLSFPAGIDEVPLLENVSKMTIRLVDVDSPERIFSWER
jgi:hypothetical protein